MIGFVSAPTAKPAIGRATRWFDFFIPTQAPVRREAEWLDTVRPGWAKLIDIDTLSLTSGATCVLGQVFRREAEKSRYYFSTGWDYARTRYASVDNNSAFQLSHYEGAWVREVRARL